MKIDTLSLAVQHRFQRGFLTLAKLIIFCLVAVSAAQASDRWTVEEAQAWYADQPWFVGCNFIPSNAINQLEMWQAETFDAATIDRELGWAQSLGFNTLRVFLHDLAWKDDPQGFCERVDKFLQIAEDHNIRVMLVLFDGVWDPDPQSGPQRRPRAGVHNSGWVQGPGRCILSDEQRTNALRPYVVEVVRRFGRDGRVLAWDLFNEPDNPNKSSYGPLELPNKDQAAARLVNRAFVWAREASPSQPLTVGVWAGGPWNDELALNRVHHAALAESDVVSFHNYGDPDDLKTRIAELRHLDRPMLCTEFMARGNGSTFEAILPVLQQEKIAAYCWGLVDGKSQTKYPWNSWQMPIAGEPKPWHHDIFHTDGRPYCQAEVEFIRRATAPEKSAVPVTASGG